MSTTKCTWTDLRRSSESNRLIAGEPGLPVWSPISVGVAGALIYRLVAHFCEPLTRAGDGDGPDYSVDGYGTG